MRKYTKECPMRNLFFLLFFIAVVVVFVGCDPFIDTYVPREIVGQCSQVANGIYADYIQCLKAHGCVLQADPMPLSETPVYICK
jgi:hypothetical protein